MDLLYRVKTLWAALLLIITYLACYHYLSSRQSPFSSDRQYSYG